MAEQDTFDLTPYLSEGKPQDKQEQLEFDLTPFLSEAEPVSAGASSERVFSLNLPDEVANDSDFLAKTNQVSTNLGIPEEDLLRVIQFETAGSFAPDQLSGTSSAVGLIQFMPDTAKDLGTTSKDLALLNRVQQMDFVEKYLSRFKGKMKDFGDIYMAVHFPAAVGKDDDYVVYAKDHEYKGRRKAYAANKGMDVNKDGKVTKAEAVARAIGDK